MKVNNQGPNKLAQEANTLLADLFPGDMMILGARPGQGKTLLSLRLIAQAIKSGRHGVFFTLEYSMPDVLDLFKRIGEDPTDFEDVLQIDVSDAISAEYIMARLSTMPLGTVVVVDYLQLLDQKRGNPELMVQIRALKSFARERGFIMVFLSQIDRSYDASTGGYPSLLDVRLPNPLDLKLFNKACFLNNGELQFSEVS